MNEKCTSGAGLLLPSQQIGLISVGRKSVDGVDASSYRDLLPENIYLLGAIDDLTGEGATGRVANKHHGRLGPPKIVLKVVTHATAGTHSRAGHNDRSVPNIVQCHRLGSFARVMQP